MALTYTKSGQQFTIPLKVDHYDGPDMYNIQVNSLHYH